jgi:hypothetical protein
MKFIRNIVLSMNDKTLKVYTSSRKFPFQYHYDNKAWQLPAGDVGENLTKAVLKYCDAVSMEEVVKDYTYKYYKEVYQAQLYNINSKTSLDIFCNAANLQEEINDRIIAPVMETIGNLGQFTNTEEYEKEVKNAIISLYGIGSEQIIKTAISDYSAEIIEYEELNKVFYKHIDYVKKYDVKLAAKLDKQMDLLYKQTMKN